MLRRIPKSRHLVLALLLLTPAASAADYLRDSGPEVFTYDELLQLGEEPMDEALSEKLETLVTTPFVNNEAHYRGVEPVRPKVDGLGRSLRVVHWNIERGMHFDRIVAAIKGRNAFLEHLPRGDNKIDAARLLDELEALSTADVLVLNEVDWGMRRSDYRNVIRDLGKALNMNWAFGVEFIEIDPISLGTEEFEELEDEDERKQAVAEIQVDAEEIRALHGTAVLTRYPIAKAELVPFETIGYDWYTSERDRISKLEEGKRMVAANVFLEKVRREIRRGGRTTLYVELDVPDLDRGKLTVAAPHLENRTDPKNRVSQMEETLEHLLEVRHPVILAGDLNTTFSDTTPTSLKREIYHTLGSSDFWAEKGIKYATGLGLAYDVLVGGANLIKNHSDPTASHVPVVAPNPEFGLFDRLETWRFAEGTVFDFRGDAVRSRDGKSGTLGNSNERDTKGFAETYSVTRTIGPTGKLKLDWILVKSYLEDPRDVKQTYRFAPHFARTMNEINYALEERISDHSPLSVDLPFDEPEEIKPNKGKKWWKLGG